uniref:hypothetical protein n=1 Tax=Streptomyces sp. NBC_01001 TaxID=2903713 RepID=UPI002F912D9D
MQQVFDQLLSGERGAMFAQRPKTEHSASPDVAENRVRGSGRLLLDAGDLAGLERGAHGVRRALAVHALGGGDRHQGSVPEGGVGRDAELRVDDDAVGRTGAQGAADVEEVAGPDLAGCVRLALQVGVRGGGGFQTDDPSPAI